MYEKERTILITLEKFLIKTEKSINEVIDNLTNERK